VTGDVKDGTLAFDFDGTLIHSGSDKGVHIMYAVYEACAATRFRQFLHPHEPGRDVERVLCGLLQYPGAPRFQQIAALLNSLIHDRPLAVEAPDGLALDPDLSAEYASLRRTCDATYTALNDAAAAKYGKAFPAALETLPMLAADFDLYIASGVPLDILDTDLARHGYDRRLFQCVWGTDRQGGGDKAELLGRIRARGYTDVLFVGNANRDLEYARKAGVKFYRIRCSEDFVQLSVSVRRSFPNQAEPWGWTEADKEFFRSRTRRLVDALLSGKPLSPTEGADVIHAEPPAGR
jgi:phosphoglycolate phosphatase-like HAD superfamily hydrolase